MNFQVFRILDQAEVAGLASALVVRKFVDGKLTAGGPAREVKENLQMERPDRNPTDLDRFVLDALTRSADFQAFAFPRHVLVPIFNRYDPGMHYGPHVDSAVMGLGAGQIRTDFSMTIFLSDPTSYDGGELSLESPVGSQEIKLDAGEAIVYPSTTVHQVNPVTRGVRLAAVTWIQSSVRDPRLREILYDLRRSMEEAERAGNHGLATVLHKSYANLMRYAMEL